MSVPRPLLVAEDMCCMSEPETQGFSYLVAAVVFS